MKALKTVIYVLVALVVLVVAAGYLAVPAYTHVERSVEIDAPPATVYKLVSDFRELNKWSPWAEMDPDTEYRFEGPDTGVGSIMHWSSDDPQVGSGSQEIIEAEPDTYVKTALDFGEMGTATSTFTLEPLDGGQGTRATWGFDVAHGADVFSRYMGLMMDKWVGSEYEKGLSALKSLAESMPAPSEAIVTKEISYSGGGANMQGFIAYDSSGEPAPGVLVVHEWWGHNEYARDRARQLAEAGYTALAVDMYGDGKQADHPEDAQKFSSAVMGNAEQARARFTVALETLKAHPYVDASKTAAIGYCFGGSVVLNMARMGADLDAVASFHGGLQSILEAPSENIDTKILVLNGAADPFVTDEQIDAFKEEMKTAGADFEFINYPGAKHSFTNPDADKFGEQFDLPLAYDKEADEKSWAKMKAFFAEAFAGE